MVRKREQLSSLEKSYVELSEHLVRQYGLSLGVLLGTAKPKPQTARAAVTPPLTYSPEMLLSPEQASEILGLSLATLANWRWLGTPYLPYKKIGRLVRYQAGDLTAFVERQKRQNTSQRAQQQGVHDA